MNKVDRDLNKQIKLVMAQNIAIGKYNILTKIINWVIKEKKQGREISHVKLLNFLDSQQKELHDLSLNLFLKGIKYKSGKGVKA